MHLPIIVLFLFITHLTHGIEAAEWVGLYRDTSGYIYMHIAHSGS